MSGTNASVSWELPAPVQSEVFSSHQCPPGRLFSVFGQRTTLPATVKDPTVEKYRGDVLHA